MTAGERPGDLEQLTEGVALLSRAGNRVAALGALWAAVAIAPTDQVAHRRLAATLANGGDLEGAAQEYVRYIEFLLPLGELTRVTAELHYAATTLGALPALDETTRRVATQLPELLARGRETTADLPLVADPDVAAHDTPRAIDRTADLRPVHSDQPDQTDQTDQTAVPFPGERARLRIPFRVCLHEEAETDWIQLEGGTAELVPSKVRLLDYEVVIETRRCLPLPPGRTGHARPTGSEPGTVWVVIAAPHQMMRAIEHGEGDGYRVEALIGDEWLDTELTDTGCRFGSRSTPNRADRSA